MKTLRRHRSRNQDLRDAGSPSASATRTTSPCGLRSPSDTASSSATTWRSTATSRPCSPNTPSTSISWTRSTWARPDAAELRADAQAGRRLATDADSLTSDAKLIIYRAFIEGDLEAPEAPGQAASTTHISTRDIPNSTAHHLEPDQRLHIRAQRPRSRPAVQSDGQARASSSLHSTNPPPTGCERKHRRPRLNRITLPNSSINPIHREETSMTNAGVCPITLQPLLEWDEDREIEQELAARPQPKTKNFIRARHYPGHPASSSYAGRRSGPLDAVLG